MFQRISYGSSLSAQVVVQMAKWGPVLEHFILPLQSTAICLFLVGDLVPKGYNCLFRPLQKLKNKKQPVFSANFFTVTHK